MKTHEQALRAKETLRSAIGRPEWLRGIGVSFAPEGGYCVKVNVQALTDEVRRLVPEEVDGVQVRFEAVGDIKALG